MWFVLFGLALTFAVMLAFGGMEFDRGLLLLIYAGGHPSMADAARRLTELGSTNVAVVLTSAGAIWLLIRRELRSALFLLGITLSGRLLVSLLKEWTARVRPDAQGHLVPAESLAFPSGHAANATMVLLCLALLVPTSERARIRAVWAAVWLALAVGVTRIMLGVHWPSDVIGGWAFGLFWTLLFLHLSGLRINEPDLGQARILAEGTPPPLAHSSGDKGGQDERPKQTGGIGPGA
jgi:membrane-associated phospholipid phosphatase